MESSIMRVATPPRTEALGEVRTLRDLLAVTVRRHGPRPAVRERVGGEWRHLTYSELDDAVQRFAVGLARLGVRPGDKVALIKENSIDWVISWLAVVVAGGINVPIYGELAAHEINNVIRQAEARFAMVGAGFCIKVDVRPLEWVIVSARAGRSEDDLATVLGRLGPKGIGFDEVGAGISIEDRARFSVDLRPGDLASIIYTSGTTGDPKGVMLSHRNVLTNAISGQVVGSFTKTDRVLLVLPLHHAFPFTAAMLSPLYSGAEVIFESDLRRIRERMGEVHPTVFFGVPALFSTLHRSIISRLETDGKLATFRKGERISGEIKRRTGVNLGAVIFRELHERLGGSIRYLGSGGAGIAPDVVRKFNLLGLPMMQGWGLTEASPVVAGQTFFRNWFLFTNHYERLAGSTGKPLPGVEVVCADVPDKNIYVGIHGEGEFVARGSNVMVGYYKNEAATREVMIDDWLRTGDLGRIDRDGNIFITGRAKSVIVLESGEKVYPDELEEHFESLSLVRDVCIVGRRPVRLIGERKTQVSAIIYPDPTSLRNQARELGERLTPETVRRWVQRDVDRVQGELAGFKRISEVVLTDTPLPRTDLKKIRRGQIREHYSFDLDRLLAEPDDQIGG